MNSIAAAISFCSKFSGKDGDVTLSGGRLRFDNHTVSASAPIQTDVCVTVNGRQLAAAIDGCEDQIPVFAVGKSGNLTVKVNRTRSTLKTKPVVDNPSILVGAGTRLDGSHAKKVAIALKTASDLVNPDSNKFDKSVLIKSDGVYSTSNKILIRWALDLPESIYSCVDKSTAKIMGMYAEYVNYILLSDRTITVVFDQDYRFTSRLLDVTWPSLDQFQFENSNIRAAYSLNSISDKIKSFSAFNNEFIYFEDGFVNSHEGGNVRSEGFSMEFKSDVIAKYRIDDVRFACKHFDAIQSSVGKSFDYLLDSNNPDKVGVIVRVV